MSAADLTSLLRETALAPVSPAIASLGAAARARHGASVCAVVFYGSCLRSDEIDDKIVDFYLLVDNYRDTHASLTAAVFNAALPPNVYYLEIEQGARKMRAKYAVLSLSDFESGTARWLHPYIWARFAQPCRLAYCRDTATESRVVAALAAAVRTLARETLPLLPDSFPPEDLWIGAFRRTYGTELRAERPGRGEEIHAIDRGHYEAVTDCLVAEGLLHAAGEDGAQPTQGRRLIGVSGGRRAAGVKWAVRRLQGKVLSVLRLVKAAFTFTDGARYLSWKIERHSGVAVNLTPWQRQHPILASPILFWRLYNKGAFK